MVGILAIVVAIVLVVIDQLLKMLVINNIQVGESVPFINGFINWYHVENRGIAFGLFQNKQWIFITLTAVVLVGMIIALFTKYCKNNKWLVISMTLFIGGGVGNLIDRIRLNYVVDYIYVTFFPYIFNFADCCVCVGGAIFVFYIFWSEFSKKKKNIGLEDK